MGSSSYTFSHESSIYNSLNIWRVCLHYFRLMTRPAYMQRDGGCQHGVLGSITQTGTIGGIIDAIAYPICLAVHRTVISSAMFHVLSAMEITLPLQNEGKSMVESGSPNAVLPRNNQRESNPTCLGQVAYS